MSLFKIPLLLIHLYAYNYAGTPPNPTRTAVECSKYMQKKTLSETILRRTPLIGPMLLLCIRIECIIEIFGILWGYFSPHHSVAIRRLRLVADVTTPFLIASTLIVSAALIRRQCYKALGRLFTFDLRIESDHYLVTTGPYSVVRHPGYTAIIILNIGTVITHASTGGGSLAISYNFMVSFVSTYASWVLLQRAGIEDAVLEEYFGPVWSKWAEVVPQRFIPGIW